MTREEKESLKRKLIEKFGLPGEVVQKERKIVRYLTVNYISGEFVISYEPDLNITRTSRYCSDSSPWYRTVGKNLEITIARLKRDMKK